MPRILPVLVLFSSLTIATSAQNAPRPLDTVFAHSHAQSGLPHPLGVTGSHPFTPLAQACCKTCTVGKACGNTCISRDKTCHVGPGCACDG
jgi:hypothetical protein